jgi:hypothetical protein
MGKYGQGLSHEIGMGESGKVDRAPLDEETVIFFFHSRLFCIKKCPLKGIVQRKLTGVKK